MFLREAAHLRYFNCTKTIYYIVTLVQSDLLTEMQKDKFTHVISHPVMNTLNKQLQALLTSHSTSYTEM